MKQLGIQAQPGLSKVDAEPLVANCVLSSLEEMNLDQIYMSYAIDPAE